MSDKTLEQKLADVMAEVGYVKKDAVNDFHKYRYASAEAVLKKVNAALSERGIALSSNAALAHYEPGHAIVKLSLTFHDGTDSLTVEGLGEGSDKGDKATMKASTAALKYAVANAFLISWGDDPEADSKTDEPEKENLKVDQVWIPACETASNTTADKFAQWWPLHKDQVKRECGADGAARVYNTFTMYLKRLKAEANDSA